METAKIVLIVALSFFFVALSGCLASQSSTGGGIFGGEQTTTTISPEGVETTTTLGPGGVVITTTVDPNGTTTTTTEYPRGATIGSITKASCTFLPEGSVGRDYCIHEAVVMRGEPASRCNEIADANLKADCIANSPAD